MEGAILPMTPAARERIAARLASLRDYARLEAVCLEIIGRPHYVIRDGEVATGNDGEPIPDPGPARQAQALLRDIQARPGTPHRPRRTRRMTPPPATLKTQPST